jgi:hypothetical protein
VASGGFLVRFSVGFAAGLAVVALAVACGSRQPRGAVLGKVENGSWATSAELAWLKRIGAWRVRLTSGLETAARIETTPRLIRGLLRHDRLTLRLHARALEPVASCSADLLHRVGSAPTQRAERALDTFRRACTHLQRFHAAITLAIDQGRDYQFRRAQREGKQGVGIFREADRMLPPGEQRRLPVLRRDMAQSRVEPRFGLVASALAGKPVEVRCWSMPDWRRLMGEERAYTSGRLGGDTLGFAGIGGSRINLAPDVCDGLVDLAYNGARPTDAGGRFLLAAGIVTLSHESQHSGGIAAEAVAECNGIQIAHRAAIRLGAGRRYAASLVRTYWDHYAAEPERYTSPECREGGALDLGYAGSVWP